MEIEPVKMFHIVDTQDIPTMVILTDYKFWTSHETELDDWLAQFENPETYRKGSVIMFSDTNILTAFILRWQ